MTESEQPRDIRYVQADLCAMPDLGAPFDAVVASMVLPAIPDWTAVVILALARRVPRLAVSRRASDPGA